MNLYYVAGLHVLVLDDRHVLIHCFVYSTVLANAFMSTQV